MNSIARLLCLVAPLVAQPMWADTVADWTFEEGRPGLRPTAIADQSANGLHATQILGSPRFSPGPDRTDRGAVRLPPGGMFGSGFRVPEVPQFRLTNEFTLEASFRPIGDSVVGANRTLIQRTDLRTFIWSYGLYYDPDRRQANFGIVDQDGTSVLIFADVPDDGRFHRVAGTFRAGELALFVDGVLGTNLVTTLRPDPRPKLGVSVGAIWNGGYWFSGEISRVRISDRALAPEEFIPAPVPDPAWVADWDFEDGRQGEFLVRIHDASGNQNDGVAAAAGGRLGQGLSGQPLPEAQRPRYAATIGGDAGSVAFATPAPMSDVGGRGFSTGPVPSLSPTGDFSWELVGRFSRPANAWTRKTLVQSVVGTGPWAELFFDAGTGTIGLVARSANGTSSVEMPWPQDDSSHAIVAQRAGNELRLHLDGELVADQPTSDGPLPGGLSRVVVGAAHDGGGAVVGEIDRVRIANRVVPPGEWLPNPARVDGIPVVWLKRHFGAAFTNSPAAVASADPDQDGTDNATEFRLDSDPNDAQSGFRAQLSAGGHLRWPGVPGRSYQLRRRSPAGGAWVEVGTPIVATGTLVEITVPTDAEAGAFYQVRVVAP